MDYYIGTKLIQAEPAFRFFGENSVNTIVTYKEKEEGIFEVPISAQEGYKVIYPDGYVSWSPKKIFEDAYLKVDSNPDLPSGVSIGPEMVDSFIKETYVSTMGEKTTLVRVVLVNGFEIIESSACVDKANYNVNIGSDICMEKIKDKIWMLLGFLLQTAVGGVK